MQRLKWIAVLVLATWPVAAPAIELLDVPLDHVAYGILARLEVRARLGGTFLDLRPATRGDLARLVRHLQGARDRGEWTPTRIEAEQLHMLQREFSEELAATGVDVPVYDRAYHVWGREGWRLQGFWRGSQRFTHGGASAGGARPQLDARLVLEPAAALVLGPHVVAYEQLLYRVRTGDGEIRQSIDVRDGEAEFVFDASDRFSITRSMEAYVRAGAGRWRADFGRLRLRWGPGRHNAMLLLDNTPGFDQVRVQLDLGRVRFLHVAGQLRPARLLPSDPELRERYLAAHRLEFALHRSFTFAFSEALVYGNRGLDLSYVNPLTVLFVAQANNGDHDNALASFDAKWIPQRNLELYTEIVVDDLNLRRGLRHFGNKFGVLAGVLWLEPFGAGNWDADAEWSWASQYTYTHFRAINRYQHFGGTLGSRTGPDADLSVVGVRRHLSRGWSARIGYELERHGEGGIALDHEQRRSDRQEFLSGIRESQHRPGLEVQYRGLRSFDLRADYGYRIVRNPGHVSGAPALRTHEVRVDTRIEF